MQTLIALLFLACTTSDAETEVPTPPNELPIEAPPPLQASIGQPVGLRIRDLILHADGAEVQVVWLDGRLLPVGEYVDLEEPTSFVVEVDALELRVPEQSLAVAMRGPDGEKSPFRELTVRTEGSSFVLEGHARFLDLPFSFRADPRVTDDGKLALDLEKLRVLGVGLRRFLETFEHPVEDAVNKKPRRRLLNVEKDLLVVDPFPFAGPPEVHAAFSSVEVRQGGLVARLGEASPSDGFPQGLSLVGGALRTGNTVLFDTTITLVALDGAGPLVLDPGLLDRQIAEGWSKLGGNLVTLHLVPPGELGQAPATPPGG